MLGRVRGPTEGTGRPCLPVWGPGRRPLCRARASLVERMEEGAMGPLASRASRSWRSGPRDEAADTSHGDGGDTAETGGLG